MASATKVKTGHYCVLPIVWKWAVSAEKLLLYDSVWCPLPNLQQLGHNKQLRMLKPWFDVLISHTTLKLSLICNPMIYYQKTSWVFCDL